jgi:catalase
MQGTPVQVTVRFSNASGDPKGSDATPAPRGMAVKFHLAGGQTTDLVGMTTPFFPVGTVSDFFEIVRVQMPDPATGKVDEQALKNFRASHPRADAWMNFMAAAPLPVSFARIAYFPIHAFCFVSASGKKTFVRYSWQPEAGVTGSSERVPLGEDTLFSEFRGRLSRGPVVFTLYLQTAGKDDDVNDPTRDWPSDRPSVKVGVLEITGVVSDQRHGCEVLSFDPTHLVDGIESSDDPILGARGGAYQFSANRRTGWPSGSG